MYLVNNVLENQIWAVPLLYGYLIVPMSLPSISFRHFQHLHIPPMLQTRMTVQ